MSRVCGKVLKTCLLLVFPEGPSTENTNLPKPAVFSLLVQGSYKPMTSLDEFMGGFWCRCRRCRLLVCMMQVHNYGTK